MGLGAAYEDDAIDALANTAATPKAAAPAKYSLWRDLPVDIGRTAVGLGMGVTQATAEVAATGADILGGLRYMRDATPEQRRQIDRQGIPISAYSSDAGDSLRATSKSFAADPVTASTAEQIVQGFGRGAAKVVGGALLAGPAGVVAAGLEEAVTQSDALRLQGVDLNTRTQAGAVQGAGLALAALPIIGQTKLATAGLYAIGGPGGFVAQQALTREILQSAGYDKIGAQFDPFDPLGLAVAALLPAGFAAYGLRQQKVSRAVASLPDLPPRADAVPPADLAAPAPIPSRLSPVADAVRAYPTEAVDAARVVLLAERRAAANPGAADDLRAMDQHEAALSRAEDQLAAGEPVQVADVAPAPRVPTVETPEFRAWFDGSRVVTPEGAPLVVYHGTGGDFSAIDPGKGGSSGLSRTGKQKLAWFTSSREGANFYTGPSPEVRAEYIAAGRAEITDKSDAARARWAAAEKSMQANTGAAVYPAYLSMRNPLVMDAKGRVTTNRSRAAIAMKAIANGEHDGLIVLNTRDSSPDQPAETHYAVARPEQVKSAIGNSGAFDPTTGSLTDSPYATWADQITAAIREMQARPTDAPNTTQAPSPEAARPQAQAAAGESAAPAAAPAPAAPAVVPGAGGATDEAGRLKRREAAPAPAEGPGSDAGNGFKQGPKAGERYRVGVVASVGGAVSLEKRLPAGTAATFYIGKDGNLIDGDSVNLIGDGKDRLWIPATPEQAQQAQAILDEMGRLELNDPARKDAKARLKALVQGKPTQEPNEAAPARGAGDAPAAGAADAGRPAATVEAARLTPDQARAAVDAAQADVIALRKRESVLNSLLECLNA